MNNLAVKLSGLFLVLVSFGCASGVPQRADASADFLPIVPVVDKEQPQVTGSIFNDNRSSRRFGYKQNYRVGDILTVILSESTQAQRNSGIGTVKEGVNTPLSQLQKVFTGGADSADAPHFMGATNNFSRALKGIDFNSIVNEICSQAAIVAKSTALQRCSKSIN